MADNETQESFAEFKDSFSYGSRSDLNFKFLKGLSPEDAAQFFQDLLVEVRELMDGGSRERLVDFVYRSQVKGYAGAGRHIYEDAPFTPLLITQFPLGRPLGAPGNARVQREILMAALDTLENAQTPGEVRVLPAEYGD